MKKELEVFWLAFVQLFKKKRKDAKKIYSLIMNDKDE